MKQTRKIKKNQEFNRVLKKGTYFCGRQIEGFFQTNKTKQNYLGIAISSKVFGAVTRNKIKRRIREAYRALEEEIKTGYTFVFMWKKKLNPATCTYHTVYEDLKDIFQKWGMMKNEENHS